MRTALRFSGILLCLLLTALCLKSFFLPKHKSPHSNTSKRIYLLALKDSNEFRQFSGTPLVAKYNGVSTVKVVLDLSSNKLYFINSRFFTYHFDFCEDVLGFQGGLTLFNQTNYTNTRLRKYALANLNYYPTLNSFALEFVTEDDLKPEYIQALYQHVKQSSFISSKFYVLVNGELIAQAVSSLPQVPLLHPNDVYSSLTYQSIMTGDAYGKLVFVKDSKHFLNYEDDCIYVLKGSPLIIPACQGIITDQFQTPLSHIQILAHNKRIPSLAFKDCWSESYQAMHNQWVHVHITADSFFIKKIDEATARDHIRHSNIELIKVDADTNFRSIFPLSSFKHRDKNKIGNKAANLAWLEKLSKENPKLFTTPEGGFAIPFYFYYKHLSDPIIQTQLQVILNSASTLNPSQLEDALKELRTRIIRKRIDPDLLHRVEQQIRSNQLGNSYRFRSSCNAEDAAGFSGAGLYTSKTGILGDTTKSIENAIKKVWASTWSLDAFMAREQAHIMQQQVMMGILCHRNFPSESANGVVVTRNIYRPSFPGFTVNTQLGEISVVQPDSNVQCDQFTFFKPADFNPFSDDIAVDYIAYGNQNKGKAVLSSEQVKQLFKAVACCDDYFTQHLNSGVAYDIEFKFDNGKLYLKQIRPYY